ncbi:MAG: molybdopterin molybdotransferase MoeA, partial [Alphaproteobacteria bacterium]
PGQALGPGQVYDSNRHALAGFLERAGAVVSDLGILPDDPDHLETALSAASGTADLILTSGGVSAGDHDVVRHVLEARGSLLFWRLAVKPGRPIALGQFEDVPLIGLPGNPAAAVVMFYVAALPLIRNREGALTKPPLKVPVTLDFQHRKKADRVEFVRVQVRSDAQGALTAHKFPREGAGILSSIAWADGLVALEPDRLSVSPGEMGWFTAFDWSMSA